MSYSPHYTPSDTTCASCASTDLEQWAPHTCRGCGRDYDVRCSSESDWQLVSLLEPSDCPACGSAGVENRRIAELKYRCRTCGLKLLRPMQRV